MRPTLDESTAWQLLRELRPVDDPGPPILAARAPDDPHTWLEVDSIHHWRTSCYASDLARDIIDLYLPFRLSSDLVVGQLGQSLDGFIATGSGDARYVTGPEDILRLHRVRSLVDAVVVGAGTVAEDDPKLTVRRLTGPNPVRVVLDPEARLAADHQVFTDGEARTLVVRRAPAGVAAGTMSGDVVFLPCEEPGGFDPRGIVAFLGSLGWRRILVEGGGVTISRFLDAGALDRLHVTVAPLLIGGGRAALKLRPARALREALRPSCRHFRLGDDVLFDLDLRGPQKGV